VTSYILALAGPTGDPGKVWLRHAFLNSYEAMDWTLLQSFLAVAGTGSLSTGARQLDLSQPTISRHIQALEKQLGYKVFVRHSRGVQLTDPGARLLEQARGLDAQIAAIVRRQAPARAQLMGAVRISVNEPIGLYVLPPWLAELRASYPQLALELEIDNTLADLSRRQADIAVRMVRPEPSRLIAKKVGEVALGLFAHRRYLEKHGEPQGPAAIQSHTVIGMDADPLWPALIARLGLHREDFALRTDNLALHFEALLAGVGIAGTHLQLARRHPELVRVLRAVPLQPLEMWVVVHEELRRERAVSLAFDSLVKFLKGYCADADDRG
jgi:DNA-binding transcriptional LysR family regulator